MYSYFSSVGAARHFCGGRQSWKKFGAGAVGVFRAWPGPDYPSLGALLVPGAMTWQCLRPEVGVKSESFKERRSCAVCARALDVKLSECRTICTFLEARAFAFVTFPYIK